MEPNKIIYPLNTAGKKMISRVPIAQKNDAVKKVISRIKKNKSDEDTINYVYVVEDSHLIGIVSIRKIIFSDGNVLMKDLMSKKFVYVSPECEDEKVADLMIKHNVKAIPVIKKGVFLGVVPNDRLMTIINNSLTKDIIHFAGIHKSFLKYKNALEVPFFESIKQRLPWLLIGLFGIILAAGFISAFEELLEKYLIIAFFIPAIVYMSGAIGSQHQTLLIRDLTLMGKNMNPFKYFLKVASLGLVLGIIIGIFIFSAISIFWNEPFLGLIIGFSTMVTLIVSSISSFVITYSISRLKSDPAIASGPFATIISDVSSIIVYFLIVSLLLNI